MLQGLCESEDLPNHQNLRSVKSSSSHNYLFVRRRVEVFAGRFINIDNSSSSGSAKDDFNDRRASQNVQIWAIFSPHVVAVVIGASHEIAVDCTRSLLDTNAISSIQFCHYWDVDGCASLNEGNSRVRYITLEADLERSIGVRGRVVSFEATVGTL
jgi:hypothetical protein